MPTAACGTGELSTGPAPATWPQQRVRQGCGRRPGAADLPQRHAQLSAARRRLPPLSRRLLTCRRTPLAAPAPAAAAALPHALLLHEGALSLPLAAIVPEFPRIGGQPVRDWIGARVENLPGIDGDDIARLLLPDLVALVDGPTFVIGGWGRACIEARAAAGSGLLRSLHAPVHRDRLPAHHLLNTHAPAPPSSPPQASSCS